MWYYVGSVRSLDGLGRWVDYVCGKISILKFTWRCHLYAKLSCLMPVDFAIYRLVWMLMEIVYYYVTSIYLPTSLIDVMSPVGSTISRYTWRHVKLLVVIFIGFLRRFGRHMCCIWKFHYCNFLAPHCLNLGLNEKKSSYKKPEPVGTLLGTSFQ